MLRLINQSTITSMEDLQINIYNNSHTLIFTNSVSKSKKNTAGEKKILSGLINSLGLGYKTISFNYIIKNHKYLVEASANDSIGINELRSLLYIITWVMGISLLIIVFFGIYNASWSLKPFKKIIREVKQIEPSNIKTRVTEQGNDEIFQLAQEFNKLLDRIEQAFETEKSFIANASHELRTPITSVLGQIEVVMNKSKMKKNIRSYYYLYMKIHCLWPI